MPDTVTPLSIHITERAAKKVAFFAEKDAKGSAFGLRVGVKGGGCSGLTYTLSVESGPQEEDRSSRTRASGCLSPRRASSFWPARSWTSQTVERQGVRIQQPECQEHLRLRDQLLRLDHSRHTKGRPPALRWTAAFVYARKRECRQPRYSRRTRSSTPPSLRWPDGPFPNTSATSLPSMMQPAPARPSPTHPTVGASSQGERTPSTCSIG
ncbi:hypothetical protein GBAR_LOCUS15604 [Geodia barretti]|uniref:Iron-sulfur cluster assembly accessory protein n=1 Tax=Geodia barretti TaxID=519541 RepID=A0AA35WNU1_GEOBA|nr:hypothetical protein GBAR_LOCUS15604 [Geodia barretti]